MSGDEKVCPFCAETIKAAAVVCKHCGRDLAHPTLQRTTNRSASAEPIPVTVVKKKSFKWWLWAPLGVVGFIALNYAVTPGYELDALASRRVCEDFVKRGMAQQHQCDAAYAEAMSRRGAQRSERCPAEAPNCSWGK